MFTVIKNTKGKVLFSGRTAECFKMGKDAFMAAHAGKVSDAEKVWQQIEKDAANVDLNEEPLAKKPKAKAKTK